jgi:hypothetical protein
MFNGPYRPRTYKLNYGGVALATAQETRGDLWFWYGDGVNTASRPDSLENVKAEAIAHFRGKKNMA